MSVDAPKRIGIGFIGGQSLSERVNAAELARLREALGSEGWHELKAENGTVTLDLATVVFLQVDEEDTRVGFRA